MTPPIWMYWEDLPGRVRPPYLDLCSETIRRHAGDAELHVVDREGVFRWLPQLDREVWDRLPGPMHRSDYARTRLVHTLGGLWLDFDVIAVAPLSQLLSELDRHEVVGWGAELDGRFYNNLFAGRPGADLLTEWIRRQDDVLAAAKDWSQLSWASLGMDIMWPLARERSYQNLPVGRIAPVPWFAWRRLLSRVAAPAEIFAAEPVTVMLWNSVMAPHIGGLSREQVLRGRMLVSRLLRIGLGSSTLARESDAWTQLHAVADLRFSTQGRRLEIHARRAFDRMRAKSENAAH